MCVKKRALIILTTLSLIPFGIPIKAQGTVEKPDVKNLTKTIVRVEAKNVCMGMGDNRVFDRELIPAVVDGKTYYGCCEGCQKTLLEDPNSRVAVDPISGNEVDKATAVIGALSDGIVHYFETEKTMQQFIQLLQLKE